MVRSKLTFTLGFQNDEIFFADYRGLTSIGQIGSTNYMSLIVDRIARAMR